MNPGIQLHYSYVSGLQFSPSDRNDGYLFKLCTFITENGYFQIFIRLSTKQFSLNIETSKILFNLHRNESICINK